MVQCTFTKDKYMYKWNIGSLMVIRLHPGPKIRLTFRETAQKCCQNP